jgi:hypothetical protein
MRLRSTIVSAITVAGLVISPFALADPLDPDPSFGGDGVVKIDGKHHYHWFGEQQLAPEGDRTIVAGGGDAGGSFESDLSVMIRGRNGAAVGGRQGWGLLEPGYGWPEVEDVLTTEHRIFVVGSIDAGYNEVTQKKTPGYGFVAAFSASLRSHPTWGTDRFYSPDKPGLQRLREVDFGSVTGGAVDSVGRVLVTGRLDGQTAVLRLTRDGQIDTTYGSNGLATVNVGSGSSPRDIAVHGTTALVVGNATTDGHHQGFATQITGSGYRDRTFSGDGIRLIGKPGTHVTAVDTADAGRWLVAAQRRHRAGVTKISTTGDLVTTFGRSGRATVRCTRPDDRNVIDALAIDRRHGNLNQIALALTCKRSGDLRRLASIWRPGGRPLTSLHPDGVGRLSWHAPTIDVIYGWHGRLLGLVPDRLIRLR